MHEIGSSSTDFIERLKLWVQQQVAEGRAGFVNNPNVLVGDLDGLQDGANEISSAIESALQSNSPEELENMIIELEIAMDHLKLHWDSMRQNSWPLGQEGWD